LQLLEGEHTLLLVTYQVEAVIPERSRMLRLVERDGWRQVLAAEARVAAVG
jgi:hypothetical protein